MSVDNNNLKMILGKTLTWESEIEWCSKMLPIWKLHKYYAHIFVLYTSWWSVTICQSCMFTDRIYCWPKFSAHLFYDNYIIAINLSH